jgi:ATP-dependent exoDNAse (exonuclease V) beta subunit
LSNDVFTRAFTDIKPGNVKLTSERNDSQEFGNTIPYALKHWHFCRDNQSGIPPKTDHYENLSQQVVKFFQGGISVYDKSSKKLRPLCPEDVAILCRTNAEVNEITDSLRAAGLKTAGLSKNTNFLETPEVKLFLALLNYAQNSINGLAKAEILHLCDSSNYSVRRIIKSRIDYLPLRDEALEKRTKSENPDEIIIPEWEEGNSLIKRIDEFIMQIRALPVPDLAESLFIRLDLKTIVSHWGNAGSRIHNLESVIKHAADYDQRCLQLGLGASLNNFIVYLNSLEAQEEKAEKVKGAVNVLTYHKAKGLEWHAVILESLDKDELDQDDLIRKSFFGVNDVVAKLPDGDNVYPERYILLLPWFTGRKKKVTADVFALITETSEFKNIELKTREESKRLMYVGVTRARDYLISTSFSEAPLKWLENIGCKEVIPSGCSSEKIDISINAMFSDTSLVKPEASPVFNPRYISPSKVQDTPADTKVSIIKDFEHRIAVSAKKNSDGDSPTDDQIGTCLHCIFCIFSEGSEQNTELAKRILKNQLMQHVFPEPERIIRSAENLYGFLKLTYGAPIKIHKELPLQMLTSEGQIIRGSCDLVWETNNGVVIVDYKSFQGGISQITAPDNEHYAGIYAPQLRTYCKVLEATGKKVIAILIYYAVTGLIVKLDIQ